MTKIKKQCLYEILGVEQAASTDDIKRSYKKLAFKWHPDRNNNSEESTEMFHALQNAYEILTDAQERSWYDENRASILRSTSSNYKSFDINESETFINIFEYFGSSCYDSNFDERRTPNFFSVYGHVFERLAEEEIEFSKSSGTSSASSASNLNKNRNASQDYYFNNQRFPRFGTSKSDNQWVTRFYTTWSKFNTKKTFSWVSQYNVNDASNRRERRYVEQENERVRNEARRKFNDNVKELIQFLKKRDPRWINIQQEKLREEEEKKRIKRQKEEEEEEIRREMERLKQEELKRRQQKLLEEEEEEDEYDDDEDGEYDEEEEEEEDELEIYYAAAAKKNKKKSKYESEEELEEEEEEEGDEENGEEGEEIQEEEEEEPIEDDEEGVDEIEEFDRRVTELIDADKSKELESEDEDELLKKLEKKLSKKQKKKKGAFVMSPSFPDDEEIDANDGNDNEKVVKENDTSIGEEDQQKEEEEEDLSYMINTKRKKQKGAPRGYVSPLDSDDDELQASTSKRSNKKVRGGKQAKQQQQPKQQQSKKSEPVDEAADVTSNQGEPSVAVEQTLRGDEDQDEEELDTRGGKKSKKKGKKGAAVPAADEGDPSLKCNVCGEAFPSKNKLFQHVKEKGHAIAVRLTAEEAKRILESKKGGKKKKSK